jgi:hypothetical protein
MNTVCLSGTIGECGVKLAYTETAKPQLTFTMVCEEPGRDGSGFKTFIPCLIVGGHSERLAEELEAGELMALEEKLAYQKGKTRGAGKLVVAPFEVQRLAVALVHNIVGNQLVNSRKRTRSDGKPS